MIDKITVYKGKVSDLGAYEHLYVIENEVVNEYDLVGKYVGKNIRLTIEVLEDEIEEE